jgi:hypothetical protein
MAIEIEGKSKNSSLFAIRIGRESIEKVLATGFINDYETKFVVVNIERKIVVFPGAIGEFSFPIRSIKKTEFLDF